MFNDSRSHPGVAMAEHDTPKELAKGKLQALDEARSCYRPRSTAFGATFGRATSPAVSVCSRMSKYPHLTYAHSSLSAAKQPGFGGIETLLRQVKCRYIREANRRRCLHHGIQYADSTTRRRSEAGRARRRAAQQEFAEVRR